MIASGEYDQLMDSFPVLETIKGSKSKLLKVLDSIYSSLEKDTSELILAIRFLSECQLFCRVLFTLQAADGEELKIRKSFMIRYNSVLQKHPQCKALLPIVRNPDINFVILHKVSSTLSGVAKAEPVLSNQYLIDVISNNIVNDTILVDVGYSYFLFADAGIPYDSLYYGDGALIPKYDFTGNWFCENIGMHSGLLEYGAVIQQDSNSSMSQFIPPLDCSVTELVLWLDEKTELLSAFPNPTGSSTICIHCILRYTEAYRKSVGNK